MIIHLFIHFPFSLFHSEIYLNVDHHKIFTQISDLLACSELGFEGWNWNSAVAWEIYAYNVEFDIICLSSYLAI